ncbi:Uncharacterised protein [Yersinia enterocolitica]|nr:Uncharacterised protein [Yersinia enterocolitica]
MCPWQREQADRNDAVNPSLGVRAAPSWRGRFTLLPTHRSRSRPRDMSAVWINQLANCYTQ